MGNCPLIESFPIKCCYYKPTIISSYRYNDYDKDKNIIHIDNIQNEGINKNKQENDNELNNKNHTIEADDKNNSISSNIINNNSKIKYSRLINYKREITIEEIIQLNNNLKSNTKKNSFLNQQTFGSKLKHFMTKQSTSTTNSAQQFLFNFSAGHENEFNNKKEILVNILKKNLFFRLNFNDNQLEKLVLLMEIYEVNQENNSILFNKEDIGDTLFIIEKGEIYIFNNNLLNTNVFSCNNLLINGDYSFGELCLLNEKEIIKRTYSLNSLSLSKIYILDKEKYYKFLFFEKIIIKTTDLNIIQNIEFFKYVNTEEFLYLSKLGIILDENDKNNILDIDNKKLFISVSEFLNLNINLTKQDPRNIYLKIEIENNLNKFFIISIHSIIEIFGIDYKFVIIYRIFSNKIKEDLSLFNNIKNNYFEISSLYSIFKYKYIEKESSLGIKLSFENNFCILLLQGKIQLYDEKNNIKNYKSFDYINTHSIENKLKLIFSLNSNILHAKYQDVLEKINFINKNYSLLLNKIYSCQFLSILNNEEILFFLNKMKINKYKKDDIIINDEKKCENFYIIIEGKVKHKSYNNKTIQKYSENDCFGEAFLLDDITNFLNDTYIYVVSDNLITAELNMDDFYILLKNPKINEYIKMKMCLEDKSINFCDLYYLQNLNETRLGNLYLVHNGIEIYAIKSISKIIVQGFNNEKQYITNKINILKIINHKFIVKTINKFKNDKWYFFLMEYVNGIKLNEAFKYFHKCKNILFIDYIKFYFAIIFITIDYLHRYKIIHRDIKINNFIIERDGYLKLIDIGSSKKILNGYARTMLGTPHYMAPEIIEGSNYSFSSDFYSIGICLFYLFYNKFPYGNEEKDVYKIYQDILRINNIFDENNEKKNINNNEINELISKLLIKDPNNRYSNIDLIKSVTFFRGFNWDLLFAKKLKAPFIPKNNIKLNKENLLKDYRTPFESFIEKEKVLSVERDTSHIKIENEISEGIGSELFQQIDILNEDF